MIDENTPVEPRDDVPEVPEETVSQEVPAEEGAEPDTWSADATEDEQDAAEVLWAEGDPEVPEGEAVVAEDEVGDEVASSFFDTAILDAVAADAEAELDPAAAAKAGAVVPVDLDMGPERRRRWWIWALAAVVVLALAGAGGYAWWWSTSRDIVVPDVVGKRAAEATQVLNDVALALGEVSEVPTDSAPVGTIISQSPEAGSRLKPDAKVSFVLAAAPEQTKVPNVEGVSLDSAAKLLAKARLRPYQVESFNATVAAGFVIAQLPGQGVELPPGANVALAVSKGPAPTSATVPGAAGLRETDAVGLIEAAGLRARVLASFDPSITAGIVITQTPLPGTGAQYASVVQILVSKGSGTRGVTVPDVIGDSRKDALAALKDKGLGYRVMVVPNATVQRGVVISQMPLPGMQAASKDTVSLLISRGASSEGLVPSVTSSSSADATTAITAAGFRAVMVPVETSGYPAESIFAQFPPGGTSFALRYPVICLVAKPVEP